MPHTKMRGTMVVHNDRSRPLPQVHIEQSERTANRKQSRQARRSKRRVSSGGSTRAPPRTHTVQEGLMGIVFVLTTIHPGRAQHVFETLAALTGGRRRRLGEDDIVRLEEAFNEMSPALTHVFDANVREFSMMDPPDVLDRTHVLRALRIDLERNNVPSDESAGPLMYLQTVFRMPSRRQTL